MFQKTIWNLFRNEFLLILRKHICLRTHPDKSGLDPKYFYFYKKAYKILSKILYFRGKRHTNTDYILDENILSEEFFTKKITNQKNFNKWFNEMFEKIKINDDEHDTGYENWFRATEKIKQCNIPLQDFEKEFYKKKKKLVKRAEVIGISTNGVGSNLTREFITEYSDDIFGKLKYNDLKKAHTETLIPVTKDDQRIEFKNLES